MFQGKKGKKRSGLELETKVKMMDCHIFFVAIGAGKVEEEMMAE